jgi:triacylglycerol lipase
MNSDIGVVFIVLFSIFAAMLITVMIILLVTTKNSLNNQSAMEVAFNNHIACVCTNAGICKLPVVLDLAVPAGDQLTSVVFNYLTGEFMANLVACVEVPHAYDLEDKNTLTTPVTVDQIGTIMYQGNTIGVVCTQGETCFVAFRGTSTKQEWEEDLNFELTNYGMGLLKETCAMCTVGKKDNEEQVHSGFFTIYKEIRAQLVEYLRQPSQSCTALLIGGHSLGGALGTFMMTDPELGFPTNQRFFYGFGTPRVGNVAYTEHLNRVGKYFRLVNTDDVVNNLPLSVMPNFDHHDDVYLYSHGGLSDAVFFAVNRASLLANHLLRVYIDFLKEEKVLRG